jgi:aspartate/methionine/tyrosine aminotransferase
MKHSVIENAVVDSKLQEVGIHNMDNATIRDIVKTANLISQATGTEFIRMEMGVPGVPPPEIGVSAEIEALRNGVAQFYPLIDGIPELKTEASRFFKNFANIDIKPEHIIPTVGGMQASYTAFMAVTNLYKERDTLLFIDPGFSVQKLQMQVIGKPYKTFDIYDYRGSKLKAKLEEYVEQGNICAILYSNPNNPTWVSLTSEELQIIGEIANKYDILILEDLAYFAMDLRQDLSKPGEPPHQQSVARYTDNYICLFSASKLFSYAGQRLGLICISDAVFDKKYPALKERFNTEQLGYTIIYRLIYTLSSGTAHSPQYAVAAILKAANDGKLNITEGVREYGKRAEAMKELFLANGFNIVYKKDGDENIGDGFYFTITYPGFSGGELAKELLYYGISSLPLKPCGSTREGLRACVSQIGMEKIPILKERLERFAKDH